MTDTYLLFFGFGLMCIGLSFIAFGVWLLTCLSRTVDGSTPSDNKKKHCPHCGGKL